MKVIAGNAPSFRSGGIGRYAMNNQNLQAMVDALHEQIADLKEQRRRDRIEHQRIVNALKDKLRKQDVERREKVNARATRRRAANRPRSADAAAA